MQDLLQTLAEILNTDILVLLSKKNELLLQHFAKTVSITLGRLASLDPEKASLCLPHVIKPWCLSLRYISGSDEKVQAFQGLCQMIPFNPQGIIGKADSFIYFCEALVEFQNPPPELESLFQGLIKTYKQCLGAQQWIAYIDSFPP